jgi:hypothetical protein
VTKPGCQNGAENWAEWSGVPLPDNQIGNVAFVTGKTNPVTGLTLWSKHVQFLHGSLVNNLSSKMEVT